MNYFRNEMKLIETTSSRNSLFISLDITMDGILFEFGQLDYQSMI